MRLTVIGHTQAVVSGRRRGLVHFETLAVQPRSRAYKGFTNSGNAVTA